MLYNLNHLSKIKGDQHNNTDDLCLVKEIQSWISQFQDENLSITAREKAFHKIIDLTNLLVN
ncbi:hypothetical protein [Halobacillus sp. A5]|uniref:hypothetical protein n=1 Tax=Halobacillus sp. A5 TaxID=2880263 RepID=UPI0020A68F41|nr:hypothetical protein [Halobacillus sp. A5]MCP3029645.1 hypothetical protein [Halobacillus sp. A5]